LTESEWLTSTDPLAMLHFVRTSDRKLRLFACACCRRIWHLLTDERDRNGVVIAERYADGLATLDDIKVAWESTRHFATSAAAWYEAGNNARLMEAAVTSADAVSEQVETLAACHAERAAQAALLRCPFGNPFRPPPRLDPAWVTPRVLSLANGIYDRRAFDHLPELASLLEEAGCTEVDVLGHLRGPGPHARGCHVLDVILGKT
jgi:hypothetical protein